jgi:hypothetical protein
MEETMGAFVRRTSMLLMFAVLGAAGCNGEEEGPADEILDEFGDASFSTEEELVDWAVAASAPNVYFAALLPLLAFEATEGLTCPTIVEEEDRITYEGGCTDEDGVTWEGRIVVENEDGVDTISYEDMTATQESDCEDATEPSVVEFSGVVTRSGAATQSFTVDLVLSGSGLDDDTCEPMSEALAWQYEGTLTEDSADVQSWSGTGRVGASDQGTLTATTTDEVLDSDTCDSEALSGTTTLESAGNTAVITYDGSTDCDEDSTVTWTYNGEDRGEVAGVACAAAGPMVGWAWLLGAALVLVGARRRCLQPGS